MTVVGKILKPSALEADRFRYGINKSIYFCTALPEGKEFSIEVDGS